MKKARMILAVGVWLAVLPYLGFPYLWKNLLTTSTGLGLIFFSYILYREYKTKEKLIPFDNFRENRGFGNKSEEEIEILEEEREELGVEQ